MSLIPPRIDCVRRAPAQTKFQTRPSSPPSGWHEAQASPPPALTWKMKWPVSARESDASAIVAPVSARQSAAGSRVCANSTPAGE